MDPRSPKNPQEPCCYTMLYLSILVPKSTFLPRDVSAVPPMFLLSARIASTTNYIAERSGIILGIKQFGREFFGRQCHFGVDTRKSKKSQWKHSRTPQVMQGKPLVLPTGELLPEVKER